MNKVYTLHDAIAKYVETGDCISFGGFTTNRKPYAAVAEILRQGQGDFTVWAGPAGGDWDMMIGEGRVKAYINCYTASAPPLRRASWPMRTTLRTWSCWPSMLPPWAFPSCLSV